MAERLDLHSVSPVHEMMVSGEEKPTVAAKKVRRCKSEG